MSAGIVLWVRSGDANCAAALDFLRRSGYAADEVHEMETTPPTAQDLQALAMGVGGVEKLVQRDAEVPVTDSPQIAAWLVQNPHALRVPLLLTRRGAIAGFGESRWRAFLDVGKGRM